MIIGVDFSLTATGVAAITDGEAECITIETKPEEWWHQFPQRVEQIAYGIEAWADGIPDAWVIETPAYLAKSSSLDRMFGGWWLLVSHLTNLWEPPIRVSPTQVKKYATDNGNANKDRVLAAVIRRYADVDIDSNDQADALVLAAIGAGVVEAPFENHWEYQKKVIDDVRKKDLERK